jgi:hypothetical protein
MNRPIPTKNQFEALNKYLGIIEGNLGKARCKDLKEVTNKVLAEKKESVTHELAGNLEHEYRMPKEGINIYWPVILDEMNKYFSHNRWQLTGTWVNFQKKHEFNPIHHHNGDYSFVIWLDIPYNIEDELNHPSTKNSNVPMASAFSLLYTDPYGNIAGRPFFLDKKDCGKFVIFKSSMPHLVYPFATSDEYRVSISGNLIDKLKS